MCVNIYICVYRYNIQIYCTVCVCIYIDIENLFVTNGLFRCKLTIYLLNNSAQ